MTRLYCFDAEKPHINCDIAVNKLNLSCPLHLFAKEEPFEFNEYLIRLRWWFKSSGKAKIYYFVNSEESSVLHTSFVIPKCNKFPFMKKGDFQIGPCKTQVTARGMGLYPKVLNFIVNDIGYEKSKFYMIVNDNNPASVKGITKAGFVETGFEIIHKKNGVYETVKI